jgi:P-type E1-E2 ATPase
MKIGLSEGILFRSGEALHRCRGVTLFAFDKTGTLSKGDFRVREESLHISGARRLAAALTRDNAHPIAKGVAMATSDATSIDLEDKTSIPGNGIEASYQGFSVRGGSASFCGFSDHEAVLKYINAGLSVFVIAIGKRLGAVYGLMDEPRQESAALISEFHRRGMKTAIISGDNDGAVKKFASLIDISSTTTDVWSSCTPDSKARIVQDYQSKGNKVCFVGDGVNDSIAFASADVSFSLVSGSEIAIASSDVLLLGPDIRHSIFQALAIARMTYRHSVMALLWCSLYAVTAILLASGILVDFHIEPRWAGLGEVVSVLPVVLIGLSMFLLWSRTSIH